MLPADRWPGLSAEQGLTAADAAARRRVFGFNDIIEVAGNPWWDLVRETAQDPMIWFLLAVGALYGVLGNRVEAATVLLACLPLIVMDAWLHHRTQASTAGLSSRLASHATVVRDGAPTLIPASEIVPGDLATVAAGEAFPADGIVVAGAEMQVDESALTGEAFPVRKRPLAAWPSGDAAIEHDHWGFAGTRLLTGRCTLRIVFTGGETVYGEIVRSAVRGVHARTPLQTAIADLVRVLLAAASVMCLILAAVRLHQGYGWVDALVSAVTLAVAALPEEFPVVFTFFLGVGVFRLAQRQALVRRAVSVENIGRVSCICADKTGTMTEGRLLLTHVLPAGGASDARLLTVAAIASRADSNDLLDAAILAAAAGQPGLAAIEVIETFPFTEDSRREISIVREPDTGGHAVRAATKGSPEIILPMCALDGTERARWERQITGLAEEGHKVIACAVRTLDGHLRRGEQPAHGYDLIGVLAFEDPVRDGVALAVGVCHAAGIHTIMVTGDHPLTARTVAKELGLGGLEPTVITAEEMEARLAAGAGPSLREVDVIARAIPSQKLALVRALQDSGEIVAVTGDGVNDVPALQAADIGIAMGERGTRSAREVASIVLLDDNFRTIVGAISEGRRLFGNLRLSFQYLLMVHIPLVISAALIPMLGYPVLYMPTHIVWLELIIHPTALLVFQDLPSGPLGRAANRRTGFFSRRQWGVIAAVGTFVTLLVVTGYVRSVGEGGQVTHARAMGLAHLTFASATITAALSRLRTRTSRAIAAATVLLTIVLVQLPGLAALLHVQPLHTDDWLRAATGSLLAAWLPFAFGGRGASRN